MHPWEGAVPGAQPQRYPQLRHCCVATPALSAGPRQQLSSATAFASHGPVAPAAKHRRQSTSGEQLQRGSSLSPDVPHPELTGSLSPQSLAWPHRVFELLLTWRRGIISWDILVFKEVAAIFPLRIWRRWQCSVCVRRCTLWDSHGWRMFPPPRFSPAKSPPHRLATRVRQARRNHPGLGPTEPCIECSRALSSSGRVWGEYYRVAHRLGLIPNEIRNPCQTLVACLSPHGTIPPPPPLYLSGLCHVSLARTPSPAPHEAESSCDTIGTSRFYDVYSGGLVFAVRTSSGTPELPSATAVVQPPTAVGCPQAKSPEPPTAVGHPPNAGLAFFWFFPVRDRPVCACVRARARRPVQGWFRLVCLDCVGAGRVHGHGLWVCGRLPCYASQCCRR